MPRNDPRERLAEQRARQSISKQYLDPEDNPDLDPERQEQVDRNLISRDEKKQLSTKHNVPHHRR